MASANTAMLPTHDQSALTPLERRIYELHRQGLKHAEIAAQLGGKWTGRNVGSRLAVIREKLACQEI